MKIVLLTYKSYNYFFAFIRIGKKVYVYLVHLYECLDRKFRFDRLDYSKSEAPSIDYTAHNIFYTLTTALGIKDESSKQRECILTFVIVAATFTQWKCHGR